MKCAKASGFWSESTSYAKPEGRSRAHEKSGRDAMEECEDRTAGDSFARIDELSDDHRC